MNIYTASAEEIGSLENIGTVSVDKIIELRKAAMAGSRDPITVKDLVKIRLPEDYWQNLIDRGELSLEMPEIAKPKTPVVTMPKTEATASKADLQKLEKDFGRTLEKNLEVFWNRISTKIDKIDKIWTKCTDLEAKVDKIDELCDKCENLDSKFDKLANNADQERHNRLSFESELQSEVNRSEVRNEQKFNKRFTSLESQISTMSSDIKGVSEHVSRVQYDYMHPQEFDSFGHAQGVSVGFGRGFVESPKMAQLTGLDIGASQIPLGQTEKPITEQPKPSPEEVLQRIKDVCPADNIYQKGSAGSLDKKSSPDGENKSSSAGGGDESWPPPPPPHEEQPKQRGRPKKKFNRGRGGSRSSSSDRSLSPLAPKMQSFFRGS